MKESVSSKRKIHNFMFSIYFLFHHSGKFFTRKWGGAEDGTPGIQKA
jgi:hypothetical protein